MTASWESPLVEEVRGLCVPPLASSTNTLNPFDVLRSFLVIDTAVVGHNMTSNIFCGNFTGNPPDSHPLGDMQCLVGLLCIS